MLGGCLSPLTVWIKQQGICDRQTYKSQDDKGHLGFHCSESTIYIFPMFYLSACLIALFSISFTFESIDASLF